MNVNQAEAWVKELTELLTGRNLVSVAVTPIGDKVEVRLNQKFEKTYFVEHANDKADVALCDSYGVMTGAEQWTINPDRRTILAHTTNGYNEPLHFTWTIADEDEDGNIWRLMKDAQERLWQVR